jgi:hypothetical protein
MKASLHLSQESILFHGKDENQVLAQSRSENGNNYNLTISLSTSFFFCISHNSTKVLSGGDENERQMANKVNASR